VIKMVHPKPATDARRAFYGYLLNRPHDAEQLPEVVKQFEAFKAGQTSVVPDVPFQMLTALPLAKAQWVAIAQNAGWQMTRMNLNTFARHGVFSEAGMDSLIAARLADRNSIRKARAFPYQLLAAFRSVAEEVPAIVKAALQDALEIALENVPAIAGKIYVLVDVSGSMASPITGNRQGATSAMRCIDAAALVAAALLRKNPSAEIVPFEHQVVENLKLNPRDSVMTNADRLAAVGGGGTNCSAPLAFLNAKRAKGDLVVFVSDNESWLGAQRAARGATGVMHEWQTFKTRNPAARLVCLDFVPNETTQAREADDILNIGGFSDVVFELLSQFAKGELGADHWVGEIEKVAI